jgi:DNA invertase Pin-like site-specific DNA recombinase
MKFRYAILSAVSTKKQAEGTSLADQISICRRLTEKGWVETDGPYIVKGQNRTQYLNLRDAEEEITAIHEMLEGAKERTYDVLVVYDHDRLRDLLSLVYASLSDYGVQLFSVSAQNTPVPPEEYDPYENDSNELMIGISSIRSKAEIARMRRKYRLGMRDRIRVYGLPAQIPFGYRRPLTESHNRKAVPEQIPSICAHLVEIKEMYLRGHSTTELIEYLNQNNVNPPRGTVWYHNTVRDILKNPFYAGIVQFEKSKVKKDRRNKRKSRDRNIAAEKIITGPGKHIPLWDHPTHLAILAEVARRSRSTKGRANNQFTSLIECGECNAPMWRQGNGPRLASGRWIWRCSIERSQHPGITHDDLLDKVARALQTTLPKYLQPRETQSPRIDPPSASRALIADLTDQRTRIEDLFQLGKISMESYDRRVADIDQKIKTAKESSSAAETRAAQRSHVIKLLMSKLSHQVQHIPHWLTHANPSEVNLVLHALLKKIVLHGSQIELIFEDKNDETT